MNGAARRDAIAALVPRGGVIVDVGADHGLVAAAVGAIATERMPHRKGPAGPPWVICDGLAPFRAVDTAVVAGMGALAITRILTLGPRPSVLVLHAQDDPPRLRRWLATHGWRLDAEVLAPEGPGYAEILRAVPGREPASGARLDVGPLLLDGRDPWREPHFRRQIAHYRRIAEGAAASAPDRARWAAERLALLEAALA